MKLNDYKILTALIVFLVFQFIGFSQINSSSNFQTSTETQKPKLVLPTGHLGGITKFDSSPNEELLLTEDLNSDIVIIDSKKMIEVQRHNYGNCKINSSTFFNDSSVISVCNDSIISIWDYYSDKIQMFPSSVYLSKLYVEPHGTYCIDLEGFIYKIYFLSNRIVLEKYIKQKAQEIYFKTSQELFLINGSTLSFLNVREKRLLKQNFSFGISALSWNSRGNVLLGFENGEIIECDSILNVKHNYFSISDRISVLGYIKDSTIVSGSYDYTVTAQNKSGVQNSILLDDWIVGMIFKKQKLIMCTWNGMILNTDEKLEVQNEFLSGLKKATFFCQNGSQLFISHNDGSINQYDTKNNELINQYKISNYPIIGFDLNFDATEIILWDTKCVKIFNIHEKKVVEFKRNNIVSAAFIPNTTKFIFCSDSYMFYLQNNGNLDSLSLLDLWSIAETKDNSLIASGYNKIIEVDEFGVNVKNYRDVGLIWTTQKRADTSFLLGTARELYLSTPSGKLLKIADFPMMIDGIELIDKEKILVNCQNGQLIQVDLKTKKNKIIADANQEYGSWDFKVNLKSGVIIFPNSKRWDLKMDIDVLDLNGRVLKTLENVGSEIVCVSNSSRSIEFNKLDSNKVIFILIDGSVKLWDINTDGKEPITQLGYEYYNLLKNELKDFKMNKAFLKSGLLKLPINGIDTLTFMNLKNGDWLVHDSKYRFDGTPGAIEKLFFTCGLEIIELTQVKDSLYVPNLVQRYLNGEKLEHIPELQSLQICGYTPIVEPMDSLNYRIIPRSGGVGNVEVYINGIHRITFNSSDLNSENGYYNLTIDQNQIKQYINKNNSLKIKVIAKTADNSLSSRGVTYEMAPQNSKSNLKPSIHAVMIGIDQYTDKSLQLKYAAKDANDMHTVLQIAANNYFNINDSNRVFFYNLTINSDGKNGTEDISGITPDRGNIINVLQKIESTSNPEDIILLFFAGHGEIVDKDQLLLLTTESTKDNLQGIKINELLKIMSQIPAGKRILILDACHSGAAINNLDMAFYSGKRDVKDTERESQRLKELDKLANKSGFAIITASNSDQKALELPQYEHGLLTYSLLSTLIKNNSVLDENSNLVLEKWFIAAEEEIHNLNKNQNAEKMVPVSFNLGLINDEVRNSIKISSIPILEIAEVINERQLLNDLYPLDNYQIREKTKTFFQALYEPILLTEQNYIGEVNKLIVKYVVDNQTIKITFSLIKNKVVSYKMTKVTSIQNLDETIQDAVFEIYNRLE